MSSQPDPPKSNPKSDRPKSKSKPKSSSTPGIPRSKFDDILDNTNPDDLDPLERNIFEAYKNARTLTHQSVKSHHGLKHSSTVNPAWTEHYGDWDAAQFSIDNQNKRDRGDERRKRDKMARSRDSSVAFSDTDDASTRPSTRSTTRGTTKFDDDSGYGSSGVDDKSNDIFSLIKSGRNQRTERSSTAMPTSRSSRDHRSGQTTSRVDSSRSTSQSPTSSREPYTRQSESRQSTGRQSSTRPSSRRAPRQKYAPTDDPDYDADTNSDYEPTWATRPKLRQMTEREPAHKRGVAFNDNRSETTFRRSDPPTELRSTSPLSTRDSARRTYRPSTDASDDFVEASEWPEQYDTSRQSGWTLGTAAKVAAVGAGAYGAYRLYQDPTLITDHVNADTLHTARDFASGVAGNVYTGVTGMASGVASGISSYAGSAWDTLGTVGGALGSTVGGVKNTLASTAAETMTNLEPARHVAYGYGRSAVGAMSDVGSSIAGTVDKHPW